MKKLCGYVLVKETNSGVANLVVTAYDSEKSIREIKTDYRNRNAFSVAALGKRIGSVLTDRAGRFILNSEYLEFQGNESRPDLLIVIFAPEDIQQLEEPYPASPEDRILYISAVPRLEAGAEEAFVIRLLQAQIDKFQISVGNSATENEANTNRLANAIESNWQLQDNLRDQLKPRLKAEQRKSDKFRKRAEEKVKDLSAIPAHLRDNAVSDNRFLIKDKTDLKANLKTKQDEVVREGLERLSTTKPTLRLRLSREDLTDLGLALSGTNITGTIDPVKLSAKVRALMKGVDLVRVRGLNNPSTEELERRYLLTPTDENPIL